LAIFEKSGFGCGRCHPHDTCPMADTNGNGPHDVGPDGQGHGLLISAMAVFLLPLATGIGGGFVAGKWLAEPSVGSLGRWQAVGMVGGLALGVILARLLLALVQRPVNQVLNSSCPGKPLTGLPGALRSRAEVVNDR